MKLLYCSPSNSIGGAELSLLEIIKYMKSKGHQIFVALPFSENQEYINFLKPYCNKIFYIQPTNWTRAKRPNTSLLKKIINYFYRIYFNSFIIVTIFKLYNIIKVEEIDIVTTNTLVTFDPAIASRIARVPHIHHIREITGFSVESIMSLRFQKTRIFKKLMDYLTVSYICNSNYTFSCSEWYFPRSKMRVIYNPVDYLPCNQRTNDSDDIVIGCVANLSSNLKNHQLSIKILNELKKIDPNKKIILKLYGGIPSDKNIYYSELLRLIQELRLHKSVYFMGSIPAKDIFKELDYLIQSAPRESFGRVIIESMSAGVPVIAINAGGSKELIDSGVTGFLIKNDSKQAAEIIYSLITNIELRNNLIKNAKIFSKKFLPDNVLPELETLYHEIAK